MDIVRSGAVSSRGSRNPRERRPSSKPKISIVIPTYEYAGRARFFLGRLLGSIGTQTYQNIEVIVSDHSQDEVVRSVCDENVVPINYIRNSENRGNSSENMNCGLSHATGDIAKIMHMDDFFTSPKALQLIVDCLREAPETSWGGLGFSHFLEEAVESHRPIVPSLSTTFGSPSVSFFRRMGKSFDLFDPNLIVINDHDMHQRLLLKYGRPAVISELCVGIGVTHSQVSATLPGERQAAEEEYFLHKRELFLSNLERNLTYSGAINLEFGYVESGSVTGRGEGSTFAAREFMMNWGKFAHKILSRFTNKFSGLKKKKKVKQRFSVKDYVELKRRFSPAPPSHDDDLSRLANRFGSDKGTQFPEFSQEHHGPRLFFTPIYDLFLSHLREKPIRLLEIGVGSGSSLPMWSEYFPKAKIYAADIDTYRPSKFDRVKVLRVDQTDRVALQKMIKNHGPFDVIVDDGGHMMAQQQISLGVLFPALVSGGFYFVEDLHTSYWPFGKYRNLYGTALDINADRSNTTMNYLKELVKTGVSASQFLNDEENKFLSHNVDKCLIANLPETEYGPNRLAVLKKI